LKKWIWTITEGLVGFAIGSALGYWLGECYVQVADKSVKLSHQTRDAIRVSTAVAIGIGLSVFYAKRAWNAYEGRRGLGRAAVVGKGGKPEFSGQTVLAIIGFFLCAVTWAWLVLVIQSAGHH
jgi:hypothetical protein